MGTSESENEEKPLTKSDNVLFESKRSIQFEEALQIRLKSFMISSFKDCTNRCILKENFDQMKLKEVEKNCLVQCYQARISMLKYSVIGRYNWTDELASSIKRSINEKTKNN